MKIWKKIKRKKIHENPWFSVNVDDVLDPSGKKTKYYLVKARDGVVVIPFDGEKVYLINQYRYPIRSRDWELPAGGTNGHNLLKNAKRELKEETGLTASRWRYLGTFAPAPGAIDMMAQVFLAESLRKGRAKREPGESDMIMKAFSFKQIDTMIKKGLIIDAWAIVPFYFLKQYLANRNKNL